MSKSPRPVTNPTTSRFREGPIRFRNESGGAFARGDLVYLSGFDTTSGLPNALLADADAAGRSAEWVVLGAVANSGVGVAGKLARLTAQNTDGRTTGDPVYLAVAGTTGGTISLTDPSGDADTLAQIVGFVDGVSATVGTIEIRLPEGIDQIGVNELPGGTNGLLDFSNVVLGANQNLVRGTTVIPTRVSGWMAFTGTVTTTPAQVYMDFEELHTAGVAEVLGRGSFATADSGASIASMFAGQDIVQVDAGATVLTAGAVPGVGIFGRFIKVLLDGETFNSGGVAANLMLLFQANVTDVAAEDTSFINMEIASGGIRSIFKVQDTASGGATYLFDFTDDLGKPVSLTNGSDLNDISATANAGWMKVRIGSTTRYIALYAAKA